MITKILKVLLAWAMLAITLAAHAETDKKDYVLSAGDEIRINVFQNPELGLQTRVAESGIISYPLVGSLSVGGQTIQSAEAVIASALKKGKFVQDPQVNIQLINIVGNQVSVLGAVNRPGRVPLNNFGMRMSEVLATVGGVYSSAGAGTVTISGTREGKLFEKTVDIASLFANPDKLDDIVMNPGDIIYVTPGNQVSILGQINRPGRYGLDNTVMKLPEVIALAGGISGGGSDVAIISGVRNGQGFRKNVDISALYMSDAGQENVDIMAGDVIYIHRAPVFYIYGEVQRPGAYRVERDMTIMQALALGGGPTPRGTQRGLKVHRKNTKGEVMESPVALTDRIQIDDVIYVKESWF